jgi:Pyruvate/2-oxoacid:ferredoxin oxidoreductase delta subunit
MNLEQKSVFNAAVEKKSVKRHYIPPRDRLGIRSLIARTLALKPATWFLGKAAFRFLIFSAPLSRIPIISKLYRRIILMGPEDFSQGYSIPLNIPVTDAADTVSLPENLMKKAVKDATFRAIMNSCICRDAQGCTDYPRDLGCVFLGDAAKVCVNNGIAREASLHECLDHIDRAARHGLTGQALWVEVEKYLWGFENHQTLRFMEFCFCCPCCCTGYRFAHRADRNTRLLFHRSTGWTVRIAPTTCVTCMACHGICPRHAIDIDDGFPWINSDCGGCGLCVNVCKTGSLTLERTSDSKSTLGEYFTDIDFEIFQQRT